MAMKPLLEKEEVEQLDEEQLEAYAHVVLSTERERRRLLAGASGYWGRWLSGYLFLGIFILLSFLDLAQTTEITILCLSVFAVVQWHATGINRRIDSILRLQREEADSSED